jgi:transposase
VGISIGSCHQIFTEKLQMHRVSAKFVPCFLTDDQKENRIEISQELPHPPYSPDLAPADFFLFPKLITTLKGRRFHTIEKIKKNTRRELRAITESAFQEIFQQRK